MRAIFTHFKPFFFTISCDGGGVVERFGGNGGAGVVEHDLSGNEIDGLKISSIIVIILFSNEDEEKVADFDNICFCISFFPCEYFFLLYWSMGNWKIYSNLKMNRLYSLSECVHAFLFEKM